MAEAGAPLFAVAALTYRLRDRSSSDEAGLLTAIERAATPLSDSVDRRQDINLYGRVE